MQPTFITTHSVAHTRIEAKADDPLSGLDQVVPCYCLSGIGTVPQGCTRSISRRCWGLTVGSDEYLSRQPSSYACIPYLLSAPPPSLTTLSISPQLRTTLAPPSTNPRIWISPFRVLWRASPSDLLIPYGVLPLLSVVDFDVIFVCCGTTTGTARTSSKADTGSRQKVCRCPQFGFSNLFWIDAACLDIIFFLLSWSFLDYPIRKPEREYFQDIWTHPAALSCVMSQHQLTTMVLLLL